MWGGWVATKDIVSLNIWIGRGSVPHHPLIDKFHNATEVTEKWIFEAWWSLRSVKKCWEKTQNWIEGLTTDQELSKIWIEEETRMKRFFQWKVFTHCFGSFPSCSPLATVRDIHPPLKLEEISSLKSFSLSWPSSLPFSLTSLVTAFLDWEKGIPFVTSSFGSSSKRCQSWIKLYPSK